MKFLVLVFVAMVAIPAFGAPKYGPNAVPLSAKGSGTYIKSHGAPDFWALMPYYVGQFNDSACSAASLTMVLNALRKAESLTQEDELLTQQTLVDKYTDNNYRWNVSGDPSESVKHGILKLGVSVERLAEVLTDALIKMKLKNEKTSVQIHSVDYKNLEKSKKEFHDLLVKNEKSRDDFLILNFTQGVVTGDGAGMIGHIAPVAAYDATNHRVLILDPDRKWYEPYWVPEDKMFEAIADKKSDPKPGYIYLKIR